MEFFYVKRTLLMINWPSIDILPIVLVARDVKKPLTVYRIFLVFGSDSLIHSLCLQKEIRTMSQCNRWCHWLGRVSSTSGYEFQFAVEILLEVSKPRRERFYPVQNHALVTQSLVYPKKQSEYQWTSRKRKWFGGIQYLLESTSERNANFIYCRPSVYEKGIF